MIDEADATSKSNAATIAANAGKANVTSITTDKTGAASFESIVGQMRDLHQTYGQFVVGFLFLPDIDLQHISYSQQILFF